MSIIHDKSERYVSHSQVTSLDILTASPLIQFFLSNFKFLHGKKEQIEVRECLLLFGAESFVFQFAIQKFKDQDI
jgi:hypothetical protein